MKVHGVNSGYDDRSADDCFLVLKYSIVLRIAKYCILIFLLVLSAFL